MSFEACSSTKVMSLTVRVYMCLSCSIRDVWSDLLSHLSTSILSIIAYNNISVMKFEIYTPSI